MNTPSFYSYIKLDHRSNSNSLVTQLKKSCDHPFDIEMFDIASADHDQSRVDDLLDILIPNANRWHSFCVIGGPPGVVSYIIHKFDHLEFPCLEEVFIGSWNFDYYPRFLSAARSPALRHLDLGEFHVTEEFSTAINPPTTLSLSFQCIHDHSFLSRIPTQSLTTFTFCDFTGSHNVWAVKQDTLYFPLLQRLVLRTTNLRMFMDAIVAPKLEHIDCTYPCGSVFGTFGSKFSHVRYFTLERVLSYHPENHITVSASQMLCQAFSGVRHATLDIRDIHIFFEETACSGGEVRASIDSWESLETLSLFPNGHDHNVNTLPKWLMQRQKPGRPLLHVQFLRWDTSTKGFSSIHTSLRDHCVLELKDIWLSPYLCLSTDGSFLHVGLHNNRYDPRVDSIVLNDWRELSLENMNICWFLNTKLSLSETVCAEALLELDELFLALHKP
ncbi:hypothetical protein EDC04DRAFT_1422421 [Pisolithus marmoratus]|nr:hypothetical protein EDC04DRAFT_1422421 [Pisolithus marmoratus]